MTSGLLKQYKALPELSRLLAHMGSDALRVKGCDAPAIHRPRTILNTQLDSRRAIIICDLPLAGVKNCPRGRGLDQRRVGGCLRRCAAALPG